MSQKDILIENGFIVSIEKADSIGDADVSRIQGSNYHVSAGWFDLHVNFGEPGYEYKEDIESGCNAAVRGGFTGVLIMPSTEPPVSSRPAIEFIQKRAQNSPVSVHVAGSLSANREGKELAEMYDMYKAGTCVFTDDKQSVQDAGLMSLALLYARNFGGRIFSFPEDRNLAGKGIVHEGIASTSLGLRGIPSIAEEVMISRDLSLAAYTGAALHFSQISSSGSVELIRKAKATGMKITADVAASYLLLDDTSLDGFDTVFKLKPPLRSDKDRKALIEGLCDGTIDCICSDHMPQDIENKKKEFEHAAYGAAGIETAFGVARTATKDKLSVPELISKFTTHPRQCAGLKTGLIERGQPADLTIFDPDMKWKVERSELLSRSANNPFIGKELTGKAIAIINKGTLNSCVR